MFGRWVGHFQVVNLVSHTFVEQQDDCAVTNYFLIVVWHLCTA